MKSIDAIFAVCALASGGVAPLSTQTKTGFTGPYPVVMDAVPTLPDHTIFRPVDLTKVRGKLPVVAYGNGGCMNIGNMSENLLGEVASYGFIVTAPGPVMRGGVKQELPPGGMPAQSETLQMPGFGGGGGAGQRPPANFAAMQSKPDQMKKVLDWVTRENARKGSLFRKRLDPNRIAAMGGSCGGLQAIEAAVDPRVKTLVALNSGILRGARPGATPGAPAMLLPGKEADLAKLHSPTIYVIGGPKDVAYPNAEKDYELIQRVPLFNANNETVK